MSNIVEQFKEKTDKLFRKIDGYSARELEQMVWEYIEVTLIEYHLDALIEEVVLSGSRSRGVEYDNSDLDFVVSFSGLVREEVMFNILNEPNYTIGGVKVDINPIKEDKCGPLDGYLTNVEMYLESKLDANP